MITEKHFVLQVQETPQPKMRLDAYIAKHIEELSRSRLESSDTTITVNGKTVKKSKPVQAGDCIEIHYKEILHSDIEPQDIPLSIIYENERVVVINKQQGLVVHPAAGNPDNTLVNALLYRYDSLKNTSMGVRPGIVHRLDKDTSGVLIVAKDSIAHEMLAKQFKNRDTEKYYIAIVKGRFSENQGTIKNWIARDTKDRKKYCVVDQETGRGKIAITIFRVLRQYNDFALVRLSLKTGRTHQLRVHMKSIGHPILGDPIYGRKDSHFPKAQLMLHALSLKITIPGHNDPLCFKAPMPERFKLVLRKL